MPRPEATPPVTKMCFAKAFSFRPVDARNPTEGDRTRRPARAAHHARPATVPLGYGAGMTAPARDAARPLAPGRQPARRHWRIDALVLAVAVVLRLPAFFADTSLVFDDGVFASSALAMRNGALPFRDVFSSQGPVFLPLVWLADLLGFRTIDAPRLLTVASGRAAHGRGVLVRTPGHHARQRAARGGLWSPRAVRCSGSPVPVNADGPSLALSVLAVAFALRYRDAPARCARGVGGARRGRRGVDQGAVGAGARVAGLIVLLSHRRVRTGVRDAAVAAAIAVGVYVVTALPLGIAACGTSRSRTTTTRSGQTHSRRVARSSSTLWERDLLVLVALALAASRGSSASSCAAGRPAAATARSTIVVALLVLWAVLVVALLVWEPALWRAHVAQLVPPLALLAALRPPPWRVLRRRGVVRCRSRSQQHIDPLARRLPRRAGRSGAAPASASRDALVISDDPGLVWRAGPRTPGNFADPSFQRIDQGSITQPSLVKAASRRRRVRRVVTSPSTSDASTASATRSQRTATARALRRPHHALRARHGRSARPDQRRAAGRGGCPRRSNQRSGGTASITRLNETSSAATFSASSTSITAKPDALARAEHDREPEHRADHVGAGVAEHEPLVEIVAEQPERRAHHRRDGDADGRGADRDRDRHVGDEPELDRAPGRAVEQVAEVGRERDEHGVDDAACAPT